MGKRFTTSLCVLALSILAAGCAGGDNTNAGNSNAVNGNMSAGVTNSTPATDGEIVTTEANGVRTKDEIALAGLERFSFFDPFDNRIELLEKTNEHR